MAAAMESGSSPLPAAVDCPAAASENDITSSSSSNSNLTINSNNSNGKSSNSNNESRRGFGKGGSKGSRNAWSEVVRGAHQGSQAEAADVSKPPPELKVKEKILPLSDGKQGEELSSSNKGEDQRQQQSESVSEDAAASTEALNVNAKKTTTKPAWKKPQSSDGSSPGAAMAAQAAAAGIGAENWPALADARNNANNNNAKSAPVDRPKPSSAESTAAPSTQVLVIFFQASAAATGGSGNHTQNPTPALNRQKQGNRRVAVPNGMPPAVPAPSLYPIAAVPHPLPVHDYIIPGGPNQLIHNPEVYPDPPFKGPGGMESGFKGIMPGPGSTDHGRNNFQQQRVDGTFARSDANTFPNNFGSRRNNMREQGGRFNHGWHSQRGFNARDTINMQSRVGPRNFVRAPPPPPPYIGPAAGYLNPQGFHGPAAPMYYVPATAHSAHPEPIRGAPYFTQHPPPSVIMPGPDLRLRVLRQIEYYFSVENICRDYYLRSHMDAEGWVPISVIANFNRVRSMTTNILFILDVLRGSNVVEVQNDKIRKRGDWSKYIPRQGPSKNSQDQQDNSNANNDQNSNVTTRRSSDGP
uniref:HTH La-type RNA-binding domain-containing protein n=1 Tax=Araucaria cunninghamii TaxID=56994 RepID=A0A0D6QXI2_ARACU